MAGRRLLSHSYRLVACCLLIAWGACPAHAAKVADTENEAWLPGGTPTGQAGLHRLLYGHAAAPSGLTFALIADIAAADQLFFPSPIDRLVISRQALHVLWTVGQLLEVGLGATSVLGTDTVFAGDTATNILPTLHVKYNLGTYRRWATGVAASWRAPPLSGSSGILSPADATYALRVLGSRKLPHGLELTVNLGATYDRAGSLASSSVTNPVQLFVDERNTTSRIDVGVGVGRLVSPAWPPAILFEPYAELTGAWALRNSHFVDNPLRLTVGSKMFFDPQRRFEADIGADVRLLGAPRFGSVFAGLMPWAIFVAVSYHSPWGAWNVGARQVVYVPQLVHDKPTPTVTLSGIVRDTNALVLYEARLSIGNDTNTWLSVDANTGRYQTMALPVVLSAGPSKNPNTANGLQAPASPSASYARAIDITCSAPGYITQRQRVQPPVTGGPLSLDFHLTRKEPSAQLHIRVFDALTGDAPPAAQAWLASGDETSDVHLPIVMGELRTVVRPGRYTLLVSAPGYMLQRTQIDLTDDMDFVVHLPLHRRPTDDPPPTAPAAPSSDPTHP